MPLAKGETWLSKFRWRLKHGDTASILKAMGNLYPATDPEVIGELSDALFFSDQDVRENAARILGESGWKHGEGPVWEDIVATLKIAAKKAFDEEEKKNIHHAAGQILRRLRNPPPAESEGWRRKLEWFLFQGLESDSVRTMTELCPTNDPERIVVLTECLGSHSPVIRKHAVKCLAACGEKNAKKSMVWENVLQALKAIRSTPFDTDEDRTSRASAIETIEKLLKES